MGMLSGAVPWAKKEAPAGERLPYLGFVDENVVLLRDGSLMLSLLVPGLNFETADTDELNAWTGFAPATSVKDGVARFVAWYRDYYRV